MAEEMIRLSGVSYAYEEDMPPAVEGLDLGEMHFDGYLDVGLRDTMKDLIVNFVGALVFSVIGYFYVKKRGESRILRQLMPTRKAEDK